MSNTTTLNRNSLVSSYIGETSSKTRAILEQNRGNIILIEEASSLIVNNSDEFGKEALRELFKFMDDNPGVPLEIEIDGKYRPLASVKRE